MELVIHGSDNIYTAFQPESLKGTDRLEAVGLYGKTVLK
jgi:hypothetical protein